MATKTFSIKSKSFSMPHMNPNSYELPSKYKNYLVTGEFHTLEGLVEDVFDNIGYAWGIFAKKEGLVPIPTKNWRIYDKGGRLGVYGESDPFKIKDPMLAKHAPSLKLGFEEPGFIYSRMGRDSFEYFPYIAFFPRWLEHAPDSLGFLHCIMSNREIMVLYDISDRKWYTTDNYAKSHPGAGFFR